MVVEKFEIICTSSDFRGSIPRILIDVVMASCTFDIVGI
jgi:hypothetical protein